MITEAELDEQFYGNLSFCVEDRAPVGEETATEDGEGCIYLNTAEQALLTNTKMPSITHEKP